MSCPHCATLDPLRGIEPLDEVVDEARCTRCGRLLGEIPDQPWLENADLLPPAGDVDPPLLPDLVTTAEELGENPRLSAEEGADEAATCGRCGADRSGLDDEGFCLRCGNRLGDPARVEAAAAPTLLCLACGVPNPQRRVLCLACGEKL